MFIETVVYIQQACANGQCPAPVKAMPQVVATQPVKVEVQTKVKVRKGFRLFSKCNLFKGCR